jgi:hypothetical protein
LNVLATVGTVIEDARVSRELVRALDEIYDEDGQIPDITPMLRPP